MKKKILFVYDEMIVGGSTTSLLSILNSIDFDSYEVDLLLYYNKGVMLKDIPREINLLNEAAMFKESQVLVKATRSILDGSLIRAIYFGLLINKKVTLNSQALAYTRLANSRKIKKKYDVAIGFLEGWPNCQVTFKVEADKKIVWIHPDFKDSNMNPKVDDKVYKKADNIVLVSESNLTNFNQMLPHFDNKTVCIKNIVSDKQIKKLVMEDKEQINVDSSKVNIITVSRIHFNSKGLDRGVRAFIKLKDLNLLDELHWYIIGDGPDYGKLKQMVIDNQLEQYITLLGERKNPFPYFDLMDVFLLPSVYEGEPMAVTESLMLKVPVIVTNYSSARAQVNDGVNGIIVDNSDKGIFRVLKELSRDKHLLDTLKRNLMNSDNLSENDLTKLYTLFR